MINERRNQLHEVIRLSGMNLIIDDSDHPLIIKVASIQSARMQVYFIDNDAQSLFKNHFNQTPTHVIQAPGRLEVLGNHTDYNNGLVMAVAVDKHIYIAASPRTDGKVELVSTAFAAPAK